MCLTRNQLWFHNRTHRSEHHRSRHLSSAEVPEPIPEAMKLHSAILSNGELDIGDINLADMDPEDIRVFQFSLLFIKQFFKINYNLFISKKKNKFLFEFISIQKI